MRFSLILDKPRLTPWHLECVARLRERATLEAVVLLRPGDEAGNQGGSSVLRRLIGSRAIDRIIPLSSGLPGHPVIEVEPGRSGPSLSDLDFVLQLGDPPGAVDLEGTPRLGLWAFLHEVSDERFPFYREVEHGDDVTYAALVSQRDPLGGWQLLEEGWFRTEKLSYRRQLDQLLPVLAGWPARVCGRLVRTSGAESGRRVGRDWFNAASASTDPKIVRLGLRLAGRRLGLAFDRFLRHPQWNVGILPLPVETLVGQEPYDDRAIEWFPLLGRKKFVADPFGVLREGTLHVLCEEFSYASSRGQIAALTWPWAEDRTEEALRLPTHVSYPFLVEDEGEIYLIPETSKANEVALFRAVEFPRTWTKVAVLLDGFPGVDPTVFRHEGRWWLTCTRRGQQEDAALWVWHSENLEGPWFPHLDNPVKTDVRSARPGGRPFRHQGTLYRPVQDCSKRYGWRVAIQRVNRLSPSEFDEETVAIVAPSMESPFPEGRHTLTPVGKAILVDGHRFVFVWQALLAFLRIWARDIADRVRFIRSSRDE